MYLVQYSTVDCVRYTYIQVSGTFVYRTRGGNLFFLSVHFIASLTTMASFASSSLVPDSELLADMKAAPNNPEKQMAGLEAITKSANASRAGAQAAAQAGCFDLVVSALVAHGSKAAWKVAEAACWALDSFTNAEYDSDSDDDDDDVDGDEEDEDEMAAAERVAAEMAAKAASGDGLDNYSDEDSEEDDSSAAMMMKERR